MKKVKIMLTVTTVFAVVGAVLAFKTNTAGFHLYECAPPITQCILIDPSNTYKLDPTGIEFDSATVTDIDPGTLSCRAGKCTSKIRIKKEGL